MNANESGKIHRAASGLRGSGIRHIFPPPSRWAQPTLLLTGLRAYRGPTARTGTLVEKDMKILWLTHTVSATGDYCLHRNDKLSVYICRMPGGFGFYYETFISLRFCLRVHVRMRHSYHLTFGFPFILFQG